METKLYAGICKALDEKGQGVAVIATLNVPDKDGDVTQPGAFGSGQVVPIVPAHNWQHVPIGKGRIVEEGDEALVKFQLNMKLGLARAWYEHLRFDLDTPPSKQEWSYGFLVEPGGADTRDLGDGRRGRVLKRLRVLEVSPVLIGAGVNTRTLTLKEAGADQAEIAARTAEVVKNFEETQRLWEQLQVKLVVAEFERQQARWREETERPHAYQFLSKGTNPEIERAAVRFAGWAAADLGIQTPAVKLFRKARAGESPDFRLDGQARGVCWAHDGLIAVAANLGAEALAQTTAHEVAHAAGADEAQANAFARKFMAGTYREMIGGGGPRAGRPMPGMTQDQTPCVVSYQPIS